MFKPQTKIERLLVPVDFSMLSEMALRYAAAMVGPLQAKIGVLHVVEPQRYGGDDTEFGTLLDKLEEAAQRRLESLTQRMLDAPALERMEVRRGSAWSEIAMAAREFRPDLIVLGCHARERLEEYLLGSTVERVIRHVECPVLAVRAKTAQSPAELPKLRHFLAPMDFTPAGAEALRFTLAMAEPLGARTTAVHVVEPPGWVSKLEVETHGAVRKLREAARFQLESLHLEVGRSPEAFATVLKTGNPVEEICKTAENSGADVIVISTRPRPGVSGTLISTTAERILRQAPCPVLVLKKSEVERPE